MRESIKSSTQYRGHCQFCAREQAVRLPVGLMAHHGYTVESGWFRGTCQGHQHAPIEQDRSAADGIVADVQKQIVDLHVQVARLRIGEVSPEFVETYRNMGEKMRIPYADATVYQQQEALQKLLFHFENRIRAGESFITMLEQAVTSYHGKPLLEATKKEAPEPILIGEARISQRGKLQAKVITGGNVRWVDERGFVGKSSTRAWRQMQLVH